MPKLEEFRFSYTRNPRNASDWLDVGTGVSEVRSFNTQDKTVTEPWLKMEVDIGGVTNGLIIRIVILPAKVGVVGFCKGVFNY